MAKKLSTESKTADLRDRLAPAISKAMKAPGAGTPLAFTTGWPDALAAAIAESAIAIARWTRKRADVQQEIVSGPNARLDRVQQQQSAQASRLAAIERKLEALSK